MAIESIASVKSHFETGDRPTQTEFENLIDTLARVTPIAIASAAEGGKTGLIEILGDGDVTARSLGAFGREFITAAATASAHNALGITSVQAVFLGAATTASSQSLLGISSHQATFLLSGSTASSQSLLGGGTAGIAVFEASTTASAVSSLGITNHVVQQVNTQTGAVATGTTIMPRDDTIPQNDEGDEYMTLAITPTDADNILEIDVVFNGAQDSSTAALQIALFQDSTADALAAAADEDSASNLRQVVLTHRMTAGTTSETTFKVRAGSSVSGTTTFNGRAGGRLYGGVMASSITITELTA